MNRSRLSLDFDWEEWKSAEGDAGSMDPLTALRVLFEIFLINAFERAVIRLKQDDCVNGPIHISIGQEAVAAAAVAALATKDQISASHRAHHQFLAKTMNAVLPPEWNPRVGDLPAAGQEAVNRTLAEIMGLQPGWCGGRGGSMHLRNMAAGVLGTNGIVGGGVPLATGAALAARRSGSGAIAVAFFGDGAVNQGAFHESANIAGLWKLPIIYFVENNQYAVATSVRDACAVPAVSIHAAGNAMRGRVVYGYDVPAVHACMRDAVERVRGGEGPFVVEARCYRHYHHGGDLKGSAFGYRSSEEENEWLSRDAYSRFPVALVGAGVLSSAEVERMRTMAEASVETAVDLCATRGEKLQVRAELWPDRSGVALGLRSSAKELAGLPYRERSDFARMRDIKYSDAIAAVAGRWMEKDSRVFVIGEEVANFGGGSYGATRGLPARFPGQLLNTPISECGFTGIGFGAAMAGTRPIIEIMFPDFALVAADQVFNQIGKARHMYGGTTDLPLVLRTRVATGFGFGGQHSMDPVGLFAGFPGWRIIAPSDAFEYVGLFNTAMHSLDPVVVFEHFSLYPRTQQIPEEDLDYCIPFGRARIVHPGRDVTVLVYSAMVGRLQALAPALEARGVSAEIIDLRSLDMASIDWETIGASVARTGVVATVEGAAAGQAIGQRIASGVTERFFDSLDGPPVCLASLDVPNPVSRALESAAMIDDRAILVALEAAAKRRGR
jgi:2-oxoisovalerate dehydrogenase E1 component